MISVVFTSDAEPTEANLSALIVALKRAGYGIDGGTYYSIVVEDRPDLAAVSYGGQWLRATVAEAKEA